MLKIVFFTFFLNFLFAESNITNIEINYMKNNINKNFTQLNKIKNDLEMFLIIENILKDQNVNVNDLINKWKEKYQNKIFIWRFDELDKRISSKNKNLQELLNYMLNDIKMHFADLSTITLL